MGLTGSQWGVMNETGSYPGQPWLWLYTLWYQVPGWTNSANIDMIAVYMTGLGTILLLCIPFIPGLRDIPRLDPRAQAHLAHAIRWHSHRGRGASASRGTPAGREGTHQLGAVNRVPVCPSSGRRARVGRGCPAPADTASRPDGTVPAGPLALLAALPLPDADKTAGW